MAREMSEIGKWFESKVDSYNPFRGCSVDSYVCHEVNCYIGGEENMVMDGYQDRFGLRREDAVRYAYDLYMQYLPKGKRYQGKAYFEKMAEKVVKGCEEAEGVPDWLPEGVEVVRYN